MIKTTDYHRVVFAGHTNLVLLAREQPVGSPLAVVYCPENPDNFVVGTPPLTFWQIERQHPGHLALFIVRAVAVLCLVLGLASLGMLFVKLPR